MQMSENIIGTKERFITAFTDFGFKKTFWF